MTPTRWLILILGALGILWLIPKRDRLTVIREGQTP
jgi:hypothetical protein